MLALFHRCYAQRHVFPSSVWQMKNERNEFLFEHMLKVTQGMADKIDASMLYIWKTCRITLAPIVICDEWR